MLGLGIQSRSGLVQDEDQRTLPHESSSQGELLPLAEADVDAAGPGRTQLRLESGIELPDDVGRARALDGGADRGGVLETREIPDADAVSGLQLEPEEILER